MGAAAARFQAFKKQWAAVRPQILESDGGGTSHPTKGHPEGPKHQCIAPFPTADQLRAVCCMPEPGAVALGPKTGSQEWAGVLLGSPSWL